MKKCAHILILFSAILVFASCVRENNKGDIAKNNITTHANEYSSFFISDTVIKIAIDTLNSKSPALTISLSLELISPTDKYSKEINNAITYAAYGNDMTPPAIATEKFIKEISDEYCSLRADYINLREVNDAPVWLNHSYNIKGRVDGIENNIINYIIESDVFSGGAHGLFTQTILNIDRSNGHELRLCDILIDNYEESLTDILTTALMSKLGAKDIQELKDMGYTTINDMYPTENFMLKKDSLIFLYNCYEIAPYSHGITRLAISRNDIKNLLK